MREVIERRPPAGVEVAKTEVAAISHANPKIAALAKTAFASHTSVQMIDEQFTRDMEETIARQLEKDIIEISNNDMRIPVTAANDREFLIAKFAEISSEHSKNNDVTEVSVLSNAA